MNVINHIASVGCLVWWFAVVSPTGQAIWMEFRWYEDCEFQRKVYQRVNGLKVTTCIEKHPAQERGTIG